MFKPVPYADLNSRQKENHNFQKVAARLADYGYNCLRLTDDWQGADFMACHVDGETILKVQLKGRLTIDKTVARIWEVGQRVAINTVHIPALYKTNELAGEILASAIARS